MAISLFAAIIVAILLLPRPAEPSGGSIVKPSAAEDNDEIFINRVLNANARVYYVSNTIEPPNDGIEPSTKSRLPLISNVHVSEVAANNPMEDRNQVVTLPEKMTWVGVYDGHAGHQCADVVTDHLHQYAANFLADGFPPEGALHAAYTALDDHLIGLAGHVHGLRKEGALNKQEAHEMLMPAMSGAVAVSAIFDPETRNIHVAHAGDCRAVIGRRTGPQTFEAIGLTRDHGADHPEEQERLLSEHPGEEDEVLKHGRVLGWLMPTRAFGDSRYKWKKEQQKLVNEIMDGSTYYFKDGPPGILTPPYVTAEPDVVTHQVEDRDAFVVMASDGLWDHLSNEQVVDAVGEYLTQTEKGRWAHNDDHAAAHLIRNAFGARQTSRVAQVLRAEPPRARHIRDDITVAVVFLRTPATEHAPARGDWPPPPMRAREGTVAMPQTSSGSLIAKLKVAVGHPDKDGRRSYPVAEQVLAAATAAAA